MIGPQRRDRPDPSPLPGDPPLSIRAFTAGQRRALVAALPLFIVCLAIALVRNPAFVSDPMPVEAPRYDQLADRLDPNVADVASLSALPQLGPRRARDIVAYRERLHAADPQRIVFSQLEDLLRIRGIGATMIRHVEPYLAFPATRPVTRESPDGK